MSCGWGTLRGERLAARIGCQVARLRPEHRKQSTLHLAADLKHLKHPASGDRLLTTKRSKHTL